MQNLTRLRFLSTRILYSINPDRLFSQMTQSSFLLDCTTISSLFLCYTVLTVPLNVSKISRITVTILTHSNSLTLTILSTRLRVLSRAIFSNSSNLLRSKSHPFVSQNHSWSLFEFPSSLSTLFVLDNGEQQRSRSSDPSRTREDT